MTTMASPLLISEETLSGAWAAAFLAARDARGHRLSPLTITFTGLADRRVSELADVRSALDTALDDAGMQSVQTVANTIFPQSLWTQAKGDRHELYRMYRENIPEYVAFEKGKNAKGLYFGRLIAYDMDHRTGDKLKHIPENTYMEDGNQLEFLISRCKPGVRISEFQASIFDPARDHTTAAQLGFPCLQHVTLVPHFEDGQIELNAFYATQQLFEKGYGNLLGLARLGHFIAGETDLSLSRVSCFVGVEKMERMAKDGPSLRALVAACGAAVHKQKVAGHNP
jgi:hypothetical protein